MKSYEWWSGTYRHFHQRQKTLYILRPAMKHSAVFYFVRVQRCWKMYAPVSTFYYSCNWLIWFFPFYSKKDFTFYYMVDMLHYSWSTEKLLDESFYFFCSFWSKSFVSFSLKLWIWPSRCQTLSVKFVIIVKAQNVTPNIRLVMVILCKKMKWAIACGWRETYSGSHIYLFWSKTQSVHTYVRM